jgi:4-amino-4-deoxy-L-arabinose transferase-like glycosyltransferase
MAVLLAVAAVYRLGNIREFPGEAAITQIEDLQVGNFGWAYINGYRVRWEYLSSTWLAALGIWLGGPHQWAMRIPFAVVSTLKVLPLFIWLRLAVGTAGALTGTALLAFSFWDVILSRIPNNHNALIVSIVFSLLAGPVRRGRPSAYVLLGFSAATFCTSTSPIDRWWPLRSPVRSCGRCAIAPPAGAGACCGR